MPSLQIRKLPEALYVALKEAAEREHRSLSQQAIVALARGLEYPHLRKEKRKKVLALIEEQAVQWSELDAADAIVFINEDRDR